MKATRSSASSGSPRGQPVRAVTGGARRAAPPCRRTRPRGVLRTTGQPTCAPNPATSASVRTSAQRGHGTPSSVSRRRMTSLSWACSRASGPGRTTTPSAWSSRRCSVGTCSWSKVSTSQPAAKARSASRSSSSPTSVPGTTSAALSSGSRASTRRVTPRPIAGAAIIRASWPPPTTPTTGNPRASTSRDPTGARTRSGPAGHGDPRHPAGPLPATTRSWGQRAGRSRRLPAALRPLGRACAACRPAPRAVAARQLLQRVCQPGLSCRPAPRAVAARQVGHLEQARGCFVVDSLKWSSARARGPARGRSASAAPRRCPRRSPAPSRPARCRATGNSFMKP